jgi:hypothetical protein
MKLRWNGGRLLSVRDKLLDVLEKNVSEESGILLMGVPCGASTFEDEKERTVHSFCSFTLFFVPES